MAMTRPGSAATGALTWAIPLAVAVWIVIFAWRPANFWLLMAAGTGGLGGLALCLRGVFPIEEGVGAQDLGIGAAAAAALYGVCALGRAIAGRLLPSAPGQISDVYALRAQAPWPVIALLLILVVGPGEEVFWRGLVQWGLVRRFGPGLGWGAATAIYGGVHAAAANPMLILAALVAGGFWGLLYLRIGRIAPLIVSHVLWDLAVFLLLPFR